ncbi:MAG TPA: hypothetical protein VL547_20870 [Dinghuibacter sp.]|uniref:hypothetical protein n=1 Tax=Dinghuibacter sp. TaxID=2024697 RepID=UPI002C785F71|nr:hypothetical protein [Dinghuibacter sp.]HTJ14510.1 hypothetical protein [Dinghuibacter sp.]
MKPYFVAALLSAICLTSASLSAIAQKDSTSAVPKTEEEPEGRYHWNPLDVIPLTDSIALYRINYHENEEGLAMVNRSGNLVGQEVPLPKGMFDIALFHGKALAFYTMDAAKGNREVRFRPVNLVTGEVGPEQTIFSMHSPFVIHYTVERDAAKRFLGLLVTMTGYQNLKGEENASKAVDIANLGSIQKATLITLNAALEQEEHELSGAYEGKAFIGAGMSPKGDLFYTYTHNGELTTEKYTPAGELAATLSCPWQVEGFAIGGHACGEVDPATGNAYTLQLQFVMHKDIHHACAYRFDFGASQVYVGKEETLDKEYLKNFKHDASGNKMRGYQSVYGLDGAVMQPVQIVETRDFVIVSQEIQYLISGRSFTDFNYGIGSLMIYDKQLHFLRQVLLDKHSVTPYSMGQGRQMLHLDGDKIDILTVGSFGEDRHSNIGYYTLDPATGALSARFIVRNRECRGLEPMPATAFWSGKAPVIPYFWFRLAGWNTTKERARVEPAVFE